jgi:hypothetical protein
MEIAVAEYAGSGGGNSSLDFVQPYRFFSIYELKDASTYFWVYGLQLPFVFISGFGQCSSDCLMVTMVYHISGQMSVLALRIANLTTDPTRCTDELHEIIKLHQRLLR